MKRLSDKELRRWQKYGRFDEHLATLHSLAYGEPYIYEDTYLVYYDPNDKSLSITLFELNGDKDKTECVKASICMFNPENMSLTTPEKMPITIGDYHCENTFFDRDYQISLSRFNDKLQGKNYKDLRYRVNNALKRRYRLKIGKEVTPAHNDLIKLNLTQKVFNSWDVDLCNKIKEYVERFSSPIIFNVILDGTLIGFDIVDFMDHTMSVPFGFYLRHPSLADFILYKEIQYAKEHNFEWLDIGWACNSGLEEFKKKWMATPRFDIWTQEYSYNSH